MVSSCTKSGKTNDPILRKISDRQTDGQTDGRTDRLTDKQMDKSDFTGCCPINVKCPKSIVKTKARLT